MATRTTTTQQQAKELLLTCAEAIKRGGWVCGVVFKPQVTDAPRNQKPPGCAVGLLGMWGDQVPVVTEKTTNNCWILTSYDQNPSDWDAANPTYDVAVSALYALARAADALQEGSGEWDETTYDIVETEEFVIGYNDSKLTPKEAESWFRDAAQYVR